MCLKLSCSDTFTVGTWRYRDAPKLRDAPSSVFYFHHIVTHDLYKFMVTFLSIAYLSSVVTVELLLHCTSQHILTFMTDDHAIELFSNPGLRTYVSMSSFPHVNNVL